MNLSRKTLIGTFALVATLSAPFAFAQSKADAASTTDATAQPTTAAADASAAPPAAPQATTSNDASAATTQAAPVKKSWADVDADKSGALSKDEAAAVPALGQVFDKADANADGSLTGEEYKAYVKSQDGKK